MIRLPRHHHRCALALLVGAWSLAGTARAQADASTLSLLVERSDAIAVLRVLHVDVQPGQERTVTFGVEQLVSARAAGARLARVILSEPDGHGCGRSLWAVVPGRRFLAFLDGADDRWRLGPGASRALVALPAPEVEQHVRALLAAGPGGRLALLCAALASPADRVRDDAALALPLLPDLERATAAQRARIVERLAAALRPAAGNAVAGVAPSLMAAAARLRAEQALDPLLGAYLGRTAPGTDRAVLDAALRIGDEATAQRLTALLAAGTDADADDRHGRALQLLEQLPPSAAARDALQAVLQAQAGRSAGLALRAARALLRSGASADDLARWAGPELAQAAAVARPTRPRFRSIRPSPPR